MTKPSVFGGSLNFVCDSIAINEASDSNQDINGCLIAYVFRAIISNLKYRT